MRNLFLFLAPLIFATAAQAQVSNVDMTKFPAQTAGEYGPTAAVEDGLPLGPYLYTAGAHTDGENAGGGENQGAFRLICRPGQVLGDDALVAPGVKGGSPHQHQFYGNTGANFKSTYVSLRTSGTSTCGGRLNRTGYWIPAMISGGKVVKFDFASLYYKRPPANSIYCDPNNAAFIGICVGVPNNFHMIFGWNPVTRSASRGAITFKCVTGSTNRSEFMSDMVSAAAFCQPGDRFFAKLSAPPCWDGVNLDTPDHRSHTAYPEGNGSHLDKCPSTHPYLIPHFEAQTAYLVDANLDTSGTWTESTNTWYFASDRMPEQPIYRPGTTFHQDYMEGWNPRAKKVWTDNCINRFLNCSGGDLGNGYGLKSDEPDVEPSPRKVPVPVIRGSSATFSGHVGHTM